MSPERRHERILITVKTYPTPAKSSIEQSCTAGITEGGDWIRLFPIPYRLLTPQQQFRKYEWIEGDVVKAASDHRPESHHIAWDSITVSSPPLKTDRAWRARKDVVLPLKSHCLCCLKAERNATGSPTLGIFKPKTIDRFRIVREERADWTPEELAKLQQPQFFLDPPRNMLEKIPYKFYYDFHCDEDHCKGHQIHCTDWEICESYRRWSYDYGSNWEAKFRAKYEEELLTKKDLHFYVGTMAGHPSEWIIVGLFYPPREA